MGVMSEAPFERTRQRTPSLFVGKLSGLQGHMQGDYRDYRNTSGECVETPRTQLHTALHGLRERVKCHNANLKTSVLSKSRQNGQLAGVEATFGVRGAGSGLLTPAPPRGIPARLPHCAKEERGVVQADGGL